MSDQTAITPYDRFKTVLQGDQVQARFRDILDKRSPAYLASLLSVVAGNNALQACKPASILTSAAKAAILNLPIEPALGFAYIVPFKDEAIFILGYKGYIQLALRTSVYVAINAVEIYQGEQIVENRLTGEITLNGKRTGDEVTGFAAYFKLKNGFEKFIYMTIDDVHSHAKKYSKSYGNSRSAWTTDFNAMGKKTVLRLLLGKYGLLSIDMQDADVPFVDATGGNGRLTEMPDLTVPSFDDVIDGQMADPGAEQASSEQIMPLDDEIIALPSDPETVVGDEDRPASQDANVKAPAAQASTNGKDTVYQAVVDAGLSENVHAAKETLNRYCKTGYSSVEQAIAWMRLYRGWRELGGDPKQAAEAANKGEEPK